MNTKDNEQQLKDIKGQAGDRAEPKGQDILKADAEGAGSEASEFAESGSNSLTDTQSNASEAGDSETVGHP